MSDNGEDEESDNREDEESDNREDEESDNREDEESDNREDEEMTEVFCSLLVRLANIKIVPTLFASSY